MIVYPKQRKTNMDKIDMIRAEIERLKSKYRHNGLWLSSTQSLLAGAKIEAMNELLPFLDSLQQEQQEVDLERDAVQFCFDKGLNVTPYQAKTIARHFYELGKNSK